MILGLISRKKYIDAPIISSCQPGIYFPAPVYLTGLIAPVLLTVVGEHPKVDPSALLVDLVVFGSLAHPKLAKLPNQNFKTVHKP